MLVPQSERADWGLALPGSSSSSRGASTGQNPQWSPNEQEMRDFACVFESEPVEKAEITRETKGNE
eukprot:759846-Hanusia_phi.AAC.7